jgi:hypothetical protein
MSNLGIPESEISNYDLLAVQILYSNAVGIPITVGIESIILTAQPVVLVARSRYFKNLFEKIDFRYTSLVIFDQFTAIWNYVNGATDIYDTFRNLKYSELIAMLPFITEFQIISKAFYDTYLKAVTGFSNYDNYEVSLMRSSTPKLIIELDNFFGEDRTLSNYWKQKLAIGLSNLEGANTNLANISIKPMQQNSEVVCGLKPSTPNYIPTIRSGLGTPTFIKNAF